MVKAKLRLGGGGMGSYLRRELYKDLKEVVGSWSKGMSVLEMILRICLWYWFGLGVCGCELEKRVRLKGIILVPKL